MAYRNANRSNRGRSPARQGGRGFNRRGGGGRGNGPSRNVNHRKNGGNRSGGARRSGEGHEENSKSLSFKYKEPSKMKQIKIELESFGHEKVDLPMFDEEQRYETLFILI